MISKYSVVVVLWMLSTGMLAQTGPAGVGTSANNVLWLKADAGTSSTTNGAAISSWSDQSGNGINVAQSTAAQQPLFQENILNGFPAVQFDNNSTAGQNDKLLGPDSPLLDNTNGYTFFTVSRPQYLGDARVVVSKRTTVSVDQSFMLFYYTGNKFHVDIQTTNDRFSNPTAFSTGTNHLIDIVYDGTLPEASRSKIYIGETLSKVSKETSASIPDNASPLIIGSTDASDERPFGGYISEVIMYRQALNKASRILVNNYLSSKYDIALSTNDKYQGDLPANGNYDRQVAGIGKDTIMPGAVEGSNLAFAASASGGLGMTSVSGLDVGDYILAGYNAPVNTSITSDVAGMSGTNNTRWLRVWYIDVTNTSTDNTVNLEFNQVSGGVPFSSSDPNDYVLLYRTASSGNWSELATASSVAGNAVRFNSVVLSADGYYSLGTKNVPPDPLPVTLLSFTGKAAEETNMLQWISATEQNNSHYTVERSSDGINFNTIGQVFSKATSGNSIQNISYEFTDEQPVAGINYYRLRQTDLSGNSKNFSVISIEHSNAAPVFAAYPNPGNGVFRIQSNVTGSEEATITVMDVFGREVYRTVHTTFELNSLEFDLRAISRGQYTLVVNLGGQDYSSRLVLTNTN